MFKRLRAPLNSQIEVTGMCTHICSHCYNFWRKNNGQSPSPKTDVLVTENAKVIMGKLNHSKVFNVVITGGEPLLNFETSLLCIQLATNAGMDANMNSNLVLLTPEKAISLKKAGLTHILTSVLGPTPEIHEKLTQRTNSFNAFVRGYEAARSAGIGISANMVVTQSNINHVRATAEFVARIGITNFTATRAGCPGNCGDFSGVAITHEQLVSYLNELVKIKKELGLNIDALEPTPYCGLFGVENLEQFTSRKCCAGLTTLTVSYDGTVRPCSHFDLPYGNLITEDLETIWGRMNPWRNGENIPTACRSCRLLPICNGGCRMEAKMRSNGINELDPYATPEHAEQVAQILRKHIKSCMPPSRIEHFKTADFRIREEDFGGVAVVKSKRALLDKTGYEIMCQLKPNTTYHLKNLNINWHDADPQEFLSGLYLRHIVKYA